MRRQLGHPSLTARWVAAQRLRLERTRPSTPGGDVEAERRLYRAVAGGVRVPARPRLRAGATDPLHRRRGRARHRARHGPDRAPRRRLRRPRPALRRRRRALVRGGPSRHASRQAPPAARARCRDRADVAYVALDLIDRRPGRRARRRPATTPPLPSLFVGEGLFDPHARGLGGRLLRMRARAGAGQRAGRHLPRRARRERAHPGAALRARAWSVRPPASAGATSSGPATREKLLVVTGWRVAHTESTARRRLDPGAHVLLVVCEPDPGRGADRRPLLSRAQVPAPDGASAPRAGRRHGDAPGRRRARPGPPPRPPAR